MSFQKAFEELRDYAKRQPLRILIWGPGLSASDKKLEKMQDSITKEFEEASVAFSESLPVLDLQGLSVPEQELWHLAACDLCIVLDTTKGPGEEIAHFVSTKYASKLFILTNEKHKNALSFPAELRKLGYQQFYSDKEYQSCNLINRVISRLTHIGLRKFIETPY